MEGGIGLYRKEREIACVEIEEGWKLKNLSYTLLFWNVS